MTHQPRRALIVIDVQNEYFTGELPIEYPPVDGSLRNITAAMDAAHAKGIPVIVIQHDSPADSAAFAHGSEGWELHPEVARRHRDAYFAKTLPSSFDETGLGRWLGERGIDTLTVVGYMTQNCDDTTIKHAFDRGMNVEWLHDAAGAVSYANHAGYASAEEIHRVYGVVLHSRFAAVLSLNEWLECLDKGERAKRGDILTSRRDAQRQRQAA